MAKAEDKQKDMFAMGFDELVKSVDANADKPATTEADQTTVEPKPADEHESNMINAFDDSTQALTDDLKVDPSEDEPEEASALSDDVVQEDSPVDINVFGQTPKQEKDAPEEFNNLKQVTNAVSEDAKPAAHGKIFGDSSSVHTPSKPHGKVFGGPVSGSVESKPVEKPSHGKDFSVEAVTQEVEQPKQEVKQPKEAKSKAVEMPKVEKPKTEKSEAKPAKKTKTTRKAVESKGKAMKDETKVIVNDDNIEITLPLNAKVIGLLGKDGVTDAVSKAVKDFNAAASKELQSAATKELKTLF